MGKVDPMYQFSLRFFIELYKGRIEFTAKSQVNKQDVDLRTATLITDITYNIYCNICRSLFSKDQLLFGFLLAVDIGRSSGKIQEAEWQSFVTGKVPDSEESKDSPKAVTLPDWLDQEIWVELRSGINGLGKALGSAVLSDIQKNHDGWFKFYSLFNTGVRSDASVVPEVTVGGKSVVLTNFQQLYLSKLMRKDKLMVSAKRFCSNELGDEFVRLPPLDVQQVYADSLPQLPIVWVLSAGSNPFSYINALAEQRKFPASRIKNISLGQGQVLSYNLPNVSCT